MALAVLSDGGILAARRKGHKGGNTLRGANVRQLQGLSRLLPQSGAGFGLKAASVCDAVLHALHVVGPLPLSRSKALHLVDLPLELFAELVGLKAVGGLVDPAVSQFGVQGREPAFVLRRGSSSCGAELLSGLRSLEKGVGLLGHRGRVGLLSRRVFLRQGPRRGGLGLHARNLGVERVAEFFCSLRKARFVQDASLEVAFKITQPSLIRHRGSKACFPELLGSFDGGRQRRLLPADSVGEVVRLFGRGSHRSPGALSVASVRRSTTGSSHAAFVGLKRRAKNRDLRHGVVGLVEVAVDRRNLPGQIIKRGRQPAADHVGRVVQPNDEGRKKHVRRQPADAEHHATNRANRPDYSHGRFGNSSQERSKRTKHGAHRTADRRHAVDQIRPSVAHGSRAVSDGSHRPGERGAKRCQQSAVCLLRSGRRLLGSLHRVAKTLEMGNVEGRQGNAGGNQILPGGSRVEGLLDREVLKRRASQRRFQRQRLHALCHLDRDVARRKEGPRQVRCRQGQPDHRICQPDDSACRKARASSGQGQPHAESLGRKDGRSCVASRLQSRQAELSNGGRVLDRAENLPLQIGPGHVLAKLDDRHARGSHGSRCIGHTLYSTRDAVEHSLNRAGDAAVLLGAVGGSLQLSVSLRHGPAVDFLRHQPALEEAVEPFNRGSVLLGRGRYRLGNLPGLAEVLRGHAGRVADLLQMLLGLGHASDEPAGICRQTER